MMSGLVVCGSHFWGFGWGMNSVVGVGVSGGGVGRVWVLSKGWLSLVLCGDGLLVCDVYCVVCWGLHGEA